MINRIISAFPGTGKTYFCNNSKLKVWDSDSSGFSWIRPGIRNPAFPGNYMKHIFDGVGEDIDRIFISSHAEVRDALFRSNLRFDIIYPERGLKKEYIERFKNRGSNEDFLKLIEKNWDYFIDGMEMEDACENHIVLKTTEFISDILKRDNR